MNGTTTRDTSALLRRAADEQPWALLGLSFAAGFGLGLFGLSRFAPAVLSFARFVEIFPWSADC